MFPPLEWTGDQIWVPDESDFTLLHDDYPGSGLWKRDWVMQIWSVVTFVDMGACPVSGGQKN